MRTEVKGAPDRRSKRRTGQSAAARTPRDEESEQGQAKEPSKLDVMTALLSRPEGASLAELAEATGWQKHSVRGAMAGTLKKKGYSIQSEPAEDGRRYRIGAAA